MRTRETFVPLALFALAFVGALLVVRQPGADGPERAHAVAQARGGAAARARSLSIVSAVSAADPLGVASAADPLSAARGTSDPSTFAPSAQSAQSAGAREAGVHDADSRDAERRDANGDPAQPDSSPANPVGAQLASETVGAAIDTLKYGGPEDRVRAIRSLSGTARNGAEMARVRSSLHIAATDDDPDVAARAQEEYEALVERDDR